MPKAFSSYSLCHQFHGFSQQRTTAITTTKINRLYIYLLTNLFAMPLSTVLITLSTMAIGADAIGIRPDILVALTEKVADLLVGILRIIQMS